MPTYQYECGACGHAFDILQSITGPKLRQCPQCGKMTLSRLIGTGGGIIFKGSGFYETDYRRKPAPKEKASCPANKSEPCQSCPAKTAAAE